MNVHNLKAAKSVNFTLLFAIIFTTSRKNCDFAKKMHNHFNSSVKFDRKTDLNDTNYFF